MTERQDKLLNLLNEKYQLNEDEALTKEILAVMEKLSEAQLQFYIDLMTYRLPQRPGSRKSKNARENLFKSMERVALGFSSVQVEESKIKWDLFHTLINNLGDCFETFGATKEKKILNELGKDVQKMYGKDREALAEKTKEEAYDKVDKKALSSLAIGLTDLKVPTSHKQDYKNKKDTEEWMVVEYGEGNKAVVHIEGGGKYKKDGKSYTEVSLFLNADTTTPLVESPRINDSSVKMKDNRGYKVRVAIPNLDKLTDASGFRFDKAMMHEILNNPESARIISISEFNPKILTIVPSGKRVRCKGCTKEIMFDSADVEKYLDFKTLMSVNTDATVKLKEVFEKADADEKVKGSIKLYRENLRSEKLKENFETVMSDNDGFKKSIGGIIESSLKGQCAWQVAERTNWFGQINEKTDKVDIMLANNCILHIEAAEANSSEIKFSIDRTTRTGETGKEQTERVTGKWNIGRQYFPQEGAVLAASFARDLMNNPHLFTLEKLEHFNEQKNRTSSKEIPDSSGIKREIEKAVAETTDTIGRNGYDCLNSWNDILIKASTLSGNSWNTPEEKDKAIEVPFSADSRAMFEIDKDANEINVMFIRPLSENEIASMPTYSPFSKNGKAGVVQKVVNGTMTFTGTVELPSEWQGEESVTKEKIVQYLTNAIKEGKVKPKKNIIEGHTPNGTFNIKHTYENEVRPREKEKDTPAQDNKKGKNPRKRLTGKGGRAD